MLEKRGTAPRRYKNMLVFAAAGADDVLTLIEDARRWMAWRSVEADAEALNLDKTQRNEVKNELDKASNDLAARLDPSYQWLLVPQQDGPNPIEWQIKKFAGNQIDSMGALPVRAANNLVKDEQLLIKWSPASLDLELDRYIWKDGREDIKVKDLWELFATYVYLPRLRSADTLLEAIKDGTASKDYLGYATSKTPDGAYAGLAFSHRAANVFLDDLGVVVRADVAAKASGAVESEAPPKPEPGQDSDAGVRIRTGEVAAPSAPKRFYGTIKLNPQRLATAAGQVGEEVLQHLTGLVDSQVEVTLEITVKVAEGIPDRVVRTVSENANTLKFEHFDFEAE